MQQLANSQRKQFETREAAKEQINFKATRRLMDAFQSKIVL